MKRTASVLAVVAIMSAAAYRASVAMPIAPLTGAQTQSHNITQIYWYHHRWYPNQYCRPYSSWEGYPSGTTGIQAPIGAGAVGAGGGDGSSVGMGRPLRILRQ